MFELPFIHAVEFLIAADLKLDVKTSMQSNSF